MVNVDYEKYSLHKAAAKEAFKRGDILQAMILSHEASSLANKMLSESYLKLEESFKAYKEKQS